MSSVLAEFLHKSYLIFTAFVVVLSAEAGLGLLLFSSIIYSGRKNWARVRQHRRAQDRLADIQNILHETITGNRIVKAFSNGVVGNCALCQGAQRLFPRQSPLSGAAAISSPLMDIVGAIAMPCFCYWAANR